MNNIPLIQAILLFFSELQWPYELFLKCLLSPSRIVTSQALQTESPPSTSAYIGCKQGSLSRININIKEKRR